ncbi:MAG: ATP synthase subunit I [Deltaproteobacteria bacterium]|nr:ATP synthase subunit I [Deltaproteobacteria bacterium]
MDWEKLAKRMRAQNWIILLVLGLASFFLMSDAFTLGLILGGLVIIANFNALAHTLRKAFTPKGKVKSRKMVLIGKYYVRLFALGAIIYVLITYGRVDPVGLTVGLSIVVFSIMGIGIRTAWKLSSGEAV